MNKLNESQQWIEAQQKQAKLRSQRSQQFKVNLIYFARWIGSGWSGWSLYLITLGIFTSLAFTFGVNFPAFVACPNTKSYCYLLRWDKSKIVIPSDYIKQSSQNDSKRKR
ncbi:hypothetical protein [Nostoc sp. UHCC 0252]|uniref:hypothetical protein n=1 Tax=Nostoc sp. UHCC 0252 TaxID=3110241 RepID=UPI002B1F0547|nr:hypothetical protein [Nostoc sp. UHCC 0252]MEA5605209.1 hypothetical protein [Nostoc sp. UHCC 0252]